MVDLYMTGLGPSYVRIHTEGHTLESIIKEARLLERRNIGQGMILDLYITRDSKTIRAYNI